MDNIIGNPPFQDQKGKSKGRKLYLDITKRMLSLYKKRLYFITPKQISMDKKKRISLKEMSNLIEVDYTTDNYFNVGVPILSFFCDKSYSTGNTGNTGSTDITIINKDGSVTTRKRGMSLVQDKDIIGTKLFNKIKSLGVSPSTKLFIGDVTSQNNSSPEKTNDYKYKININTLKNKIVYSSKLPKLYNRRKIAVHMGATYKRDNVIISYDNFGQYQNMIDIEGLSEVEVNNILNFIYSDIIVNLVKKYREFFSTGFNNIIYYLPKIDVNHNYSEEDIVSLLGLTELEQKWISSNTNKEIKTIKISENLHYAENTDKRIKNTGEVFTPTILVNKILDKLNISKICNETFLDPTCGSGQFLVALAKRGIPLNNIYGVDLMPDNIETTKKRLREYFKDKMSSEDIEFHLNRNIICDDALTYHFEFWWHEPEAEISDDEW